MSIFDNYDNLSGDYIPNNMCSNITTPSIEDTLPRVVNNIKGNFIGYSWYNTEEFEWELSTNENIENKSLILEIYSYDWDLIKSFSNLNSKTLLIKVDKELNELLKQGIYYGIVKISNSLETKIVNKFTIIIN